MKRCDTQITAHITEITEASAPQFSLVVSGEKWFVYFIITDTVKCFDSHWSYKALVLPALG